MSNAADLGVGFLGGNFPYGGLNNSYGFSDSNSFQGSAFQTYGGTANNQAGVVAQNIIDPNALFQRYSGYASSFAGSVAAPINVNPVLMDNQQVIPWPKDQQIYYKMVGFNTSTQTFETWIIVEEIVPRPETFDPTGNFPNIDYNVFFSPPSGNNLVNIKIVGRWIQ